MDTQQLLEATEILKIIKSLFDQKPNEWIPVIAAIGGAFVGGISAFLPSYLIEKKKRKDEREGVTIALLAEVAALITIVEHRKYLEGMRMVVEQLRNSPGSTSRYVVKVPDHYSRVYQAHIGRIGQIGPKLAADIIQFHQLIDSIVQDISSGGVLAEEGGNVEDLEQLISITEQALALGKIISRF